MEMYVYYSIIFFSFIIFMLYIYLVLEKIVWSYKSKKKNQYSKELIAYIDDIVNDVIDKGCLNENQIMYVKNIVNNSLKRELVIDRIIYYQENFKGDIVSNITKLSESLGFVDYEITNLKNKDLHKVALACRRLGEFRSKKAIKDLINIVKFPSTDIKYNALLALAKIGDEQAFIEVFENIDNGILLSERSLIEIIDSFEGDKKYVYKKMISSQMDYLAAVFIKSAGNYMDISLSDEIGKHLFDESKEKRIAAIKALGNMADSRYIEDIMQLLEDKEWEVRAIAAKVLGRFEDDKVLYPLLKALSDKQWYVRYNAAISILNVPDGLDMVQVVFEGEDRFAKDIIISAIENLDFMKEIYMYENSSDYSKRRIAKLIKDYINEKS